MNRMLRLNTAYTASLALSATLVLSPSVTKAAALGEPLFVSAIGQPLRVELPLVGFDVGDAQECFRLVSGKTSDGLPVVKKARLEAITHGKTARLVVSHHEAVFEPVLRLSIEEFCDARLRHDYTLLLAFPTPESAVEYPTSSTTSSLPAQSPPSRTVRREGARPSSAIAAEGRESRKSASRTATPASEEAPAPAERAKPAPAPREQDRLVLGGGFGEPDGGLRLSRELDSLARVGQITDQEREQLRREQAVVMEIDRTIVAQLELNDRIRRLEEIQSNIMTSEQAGVTGAAPTPRPAAESTSSGWILPTAALAGLSAALAGGLLWMRRRQASASRTLVADYEQDVEPYIAKSPQAPSRPVTTESYAPPPAEASSEIDLPELPREPERAPLGWETVSDSAEAEAMAGGDAAPVLPIETVDETAEEHESAIELADIMMGFGRIQGAAETLAEFIASNPKRAVTPWLKLLEVYRAANLREEFDVLAQQLNKTFNVKAVTWDTFEEARQSRHSIEQMGHIAGKVQRIWGTVECQAYLEKLLRDNRDGKREGFPLSVIDEILVLAGVLEEQLGVYRPETMDVENSDQWDSEGRPAQDAA